MKGAALTRGLGIRRTGEIIGGEFAQRVILGKYPERGE